MYNFVNDVRSNSAGILWNFLQNFCGHRLQVGPVISLHTHSRFLYCGSAVCKCLCQYSLCFFLLSISLCLSLQAVDVQGGVRLVMESALSARDRVGVQDFLLLENHNSEAAFIENLRRRYREGLIYVRHTQAPA